MINAHSRIPIYISIMNSWVFRFLSVDFTARDSKYEGSSQIYTLQANIKKKKKRKKKSDNFQPGVPWLIWKTY